MQKVFKLPELAEGVEAADVVSVLVEVGDEIHKDQAVAELETEKATAELPCPFAGKVVEIHIKKGDQVKVGQDVLTLEVQESGGQKNKTEEEPQKKPEENGREEPGKKERPQEEKKQEEPDEAKEEKAEERDKETQPAEPSEPSRRRGPEISGGARVPAGPAVRRLARELGVDLSEVEGSGPRGRISVEDVKTHARELIEASRKTRPKSETPPEGAVLEPPLPDFSRFGSIRREPLSGMRRTTARSVSLSWRVVPHVTQHDRADVTGLEKFRRKWKPLAEKREVKLSVTAILLKVLAGALRAHPRFNASIDLGHQELVLKDHVHLGVAVDAEHGLMVPVIRDADQKSILQIATELESLADQARRRKLGREALEGATFTLSNLGGLGTTDFSPVIPWPQAAILGVGRAGMEPVWDHEEFRPRLILPLSLTYDHRINDGADAARFLRWTAEALEHPMRLVLED